MGVEIVLCYPSMQMHTPKSLIGHILLSNYYVFDFLFKGTPKITAIKDAVFFLDLLLVCLFDSKQRSNTS